MNGGYVMFDASVLDLDNGGTLTGLYAKMQELFNSGKPLLLCNVSYTDEGVIKASFVIFTYDTTNDKYRIDLSIDSTNYTLVINDDDSYTFGN